MARRCGVVNPKCKLVRKVLTSNRLKQCVTTVFEHHATHPRSKHTLTAKQSRKFNTHAFISHNTGHQYRVGCTGTGTTSVIVIDSSRPRNLYRTFSAVVRVMRIVSLDSTFGGMNLVGCTTVDGAPI